MIFFSSNGGLGCSHLMHNIFLFAMYVAGLIVLRVAEVAQFQEKILRAVLNGDLKDVIVTPQQMYAILSSMNPTHQVNTRILKTMFIFCLDNYIILEQCVWNTNLVEKFQYCR